MNTHTHTPEHLYVCLCRRRRCKLRSRLQRWRRFNVDKVLLWVLSEWLRDDDDDELYFGMLTRVASQLLRCFASAIVSLAFDWEVFSYESAYKNNVSLIFQLQLIASSARRMFTTYAISSNNKKNNTVNR